MCICGRERRVYPSDVTDKEWAILEPLIPAAKPGGRPQEIARREIVNGILYVLRSGCPWRLLPHDFPNWSTVYLYCAGVETGRRLGTGQCCSATATARGCGQGTRAECGHSR
jgi:transposase